MQLKIMVSVAFLAAAFAFAPVQRPPLARRIASCSILQPTSHKPVCLPSSTALSALIDVPDGFFFATFVGSGLLLSISKSFGRLRMEERAWEQRLEEGRRRRMEQDPTLTELDLRRQEASMEWSAYGKPREEEEAYYRKQNEPEQEWGRGARGKRVRVMDRNDDGTEDQELDKDGVAQQNRMTDEEIDRFELEFGIDYDPYYDDPYTEDELPVGNRSVDKKYGDVIYPNGEIFYKDAQTGLYYRQGAKPRSVKFYN